MCRLCDEQYRVSPEEQLLQRKKEALDTIAQCTKSLEYSRVELIDIEEELAELRRMFDVKK